MALSVDAFFVVDKPRGPTSHDVVARLRRASGERRIGHAGTLDPLAEGVLLVATGQATRLIEYLAEAGKGYLAKVTLGVETDTYDAEGQVLAEADASYVTQGEIERALGGMRGVVEQRPPAYSAISVGGKRLYDLARSGQAVEAPLRTVNIEVLELLSWDPPVAQLRVECSKGTYVRSIAHDLGVALGTGAHLSGLIRTRVGRFTRDRAAPLLELEERLRSGTWGEVATAPADAVGHLPAITLDDERAARLVNGIAVPVPDGEGGQSASEAGTLCRAIGSGGALLAVGRLERRAGSLVCRPEKVFADATTVTGPAGTPGRSGR